MIELAFKGKFILLAFMGILFLFIFKAPSNNHIILESKITLTNIKGFLYFHLFIFCFYGFN